MATMNGHWTSRSTEDFVYRISSDFVLQIEKKMEADTVTQAALADELGVTDGRVSQVLRNPGNLTLKKVVEYARALGMKAAIVAYEDGDTENLNGPINSEIFSLCWKKVGSPKDFFAVNSLTMPVQSLGPVKFVYLVGPKDYSDTRGGLMSLNLYTMSSINAFTNGAVLTTGGTPINA
ncbi:MAG TPA: helix-turn-helix transcriptional regulator [Candidatus Sulfotelmatobacter sp.]|nr:helix-turn-helix transcriptional regulator [Candidatus Sulfotelmatobacter sp.]